MKTVKDMMLPIEECATVSREMTVCEAIQVLGGAQEKQRAQDGACKHRALLVVDKDNRVLGKLSHLDIVMNMEPKYRSQKSSEAIAHIFAAGLSSALLKSMMQRYSFWDEPFERRCQKALRAKVEDCMHTPGKNEYVHESDLLEVAVHQLVMGHHQSLLVTDGDWVVGILTLADVLEGICRGPGTGPGGCTGRKDDW
ncbi:MAG: CBS domain-containing protein [Dehalococcoidia bacterium]